MQYRRPPPFIAASLVVVSKSFAAQPLRVGLVGKLLQNMEFDFIATRPAWLCNCTDSSPDRHLTIGR
jgi:hypothetical protein